MKSLLVAAGIIILAALAGVVLYQRACTPDFGKLKEQASALDTAYSRDTANFATDTLATDSVFNGVKKPQQITRERKGATQAIRTSEARVKNRDRQIQVLTPRLRLFGALNYETTFGTPLLQGDLELRAGATVNLQRHLELSVYGQQDLLRLGPGPGRKASLNVEIRKYARLF